MSSSSFFHSTQTPLTLYCRDRSVTLLALSRKREFVCILKELPRGVIERGIVRVPETLQAVIQAMLEEVVGKGVHREGLPVALVVPESFSFTQLLRLPEAGFAENLAERVQKEASGMIPLPYHQLYADWQVVTPPKIAPQIALFVGVSRDYVSGYVHVVESLHLTPFVMETEMISLGRILIPDDGKITAILDIGTSVTNLGIFDDPSLLPKFSLTIPIAIDSFASALMERLKIDHAEAERLEFKEGFNVDAGEGWAFVILQERVQVILRHIEEAFQHYHRTTTKSVERVILAGGGAFIPELARYLEVNLKCEVLLGDPLLRFGAPLTLPAHYPPLLLAPLLGLGLRARTHRDLEKNINLLSGWLQEHSLLHQAKSLRIWRFLGILVFFVALGWSSYIFYQMLYLPVVRSEEEAQLRTQLNVPFFYDPTLPEGSSTPDLPAPLNSKEIGTSTLTTTTETESPSPSDATTAVFLVITDTPTGWLNVRSGPGSTFAALTKVFPGDVFTQQDISGEWYKITVRDGASGWISGEYVKVQIKDAAAQ